MRVRSFGLFVSALLFAAAARAVLPPGFTDTTVSGFNSPTAMALAPDGRIFVCQQGGSLRVIKNGALLATPALTLTVDSNGERGLLGVTLDPNFAQNSFLYVYYTRPTPAVHNRLSRFTLNGDVVVPGSEFVLMDLDNLSSATNHNGGSLHFGPDGKLYVAVGDNANGAHAQSLTILFGKILRLNSDGTIPSDNPFVDQTSGKYESIWALGLRNPFTFAVRDGDPFMLINDVGQVTWEEVNEGGAGFNYGWPTCEGPFLQGTSTPCTNPNFTNPLYYYGHAGGACAITGGAFYEPQLPGFPSEYLGQYFFADYCADFIRRIDPATGDDSDFATALNSPVDIQTGYDGSLYYLSYFGGAVHRITYTGSNAPAITLDPASQLISEGHPVTFTVSATGAPTLMYQWQRNSVDIPNANLPTYAIPSVAPGDDGDQFRCEVSNSFGTVFSQQAVLTVTANQPPNPSITAPASGSLYSAGDTIAFSGTASDPEDGALPASAFTWWVNFHHDTHFHPFLPPTSGVTSGSFVIPTLGETSPNVWYRIHLSVADSGGLVTEIIRDVLPRTVTMTFATNPTGLLLTLDGQQFTAPSSVIGVVGITRTIGAPSPQGGQAFQSWSDGGAQTHNISTPSSSTTFTATFSGGGPTPTPTLTRTRTATPTRTATKTPTVATPTLTATKTFTRTLTPTFTVTKTPTNATPTLTATKTFTQTQTRTFTVTKTSTAGTPTLTATKTFTQTQTRTFTVTKTPTNATPTLTATKTSTQTLTPTFTATQTPTRTVTPTPPPGPQPTVSSITPTSGSAAGGMSIGVFGGNFVPASLVAFGGVPASTTFVDDTQLNATVPALASGTLYDVEVANPGALRLSGVLANGWMADFMDVPQASPFHGDVEKLLRNGITGGCAPGAYCPAASVLRSEMAVFLLKAKHGAGHVPPSCTGIFSDVPCPSTPEFPYSDWIEGLFTEGITGGCATNPLRFCPDQNVSRAEMAVFLLKGEHGSGYLPPACTGVFSDVPCPATPAFPYSDWIERLFAEGITAGCAPPSPPSDQPGYCPEASTRREQMAAFLVKTFILPLTGAARDRPERVGRGPRSRRD